jgi:hypothetical protein
MNWLTWFGTCHYEVNKVKDLFSPLMIHVKLPKLRIEKRGQLC